MNCGPRGVGERRAVDRRSQLFHTSGALHWERWCGCELGGSGAAATEASCGAVAMYSRARRSETDAFYRNASGLKKATTPNEGGESGEEQKADDAPTKTQTPRLQLPSQPACLPRGQRQERKTYRHLALLQADIEHDEEHVFWGMGISCTGETNTALLDEV
ncbi:hypothetical protein EYF80_003526 [Liparis tanakae]|uniref:Uncharacterized protein n=1 Tax=Liparis tanakae TaxID=230148 RepID=A0A4Z2J7E4_9TELE|nr:hypothetical protein EYF80_003526 [Liparis tanakae]